MLAETPCVLRLTGDLDADSLPDLERGLKAVRDKPNVVVDFSKVRYSDSMGIRAFIRLQKWRIARDLPTMRFVALSPTLKRILEIVALDDAWPAFDDVTAAVASFEGCDPIDNVDPECTTLIMPTSERDDMTIQSFDYDTGGIFRGA